MNRVVSAIESGKCVLGVGAHLLRDAQVMLEISNRASLPTVALSGPIVPPVKKITPKSLARATELEGGVVVLIEPETGDQAGIAKLGKVLAKGTHKPTVLVVARAFNPFAFGSALSGIPVAHLKGRGNMFFRDLPAPPASEELPEVSAPVAAKSKGPEAPHLHMVGREEELEQLKGFLGEGGPIVISGPAGVGRRWLAEGGIEAAELTRLPELTLGWGSEADTLLARIAAIGEAHGVNTLAELLRKKHTPQQAIAAAIETLAGAKGASGQAMIVHELQWAIGREGDFFRKGRVEMLLEALLTNTYPLRLIFTSTVQPVFYTEGRAASLRRLELGGIKGRFLHEIFDGYKVPEVPRDKFGPMNDVKIHGHPMAARAYAIAVKNRGVEIVDDPKFMKLDGIDDTDKLRKRIQKLVDKCDGDARKALSKLAHLEGTELGETLAKAGIGRKGRIELLAAGLLDMVPAADGRRYQVHRLVKSGLKYREANDFDLHGRLAAFYGKRSQSGEGVQRIADVYASSRHAVAGRAFRDRIHTPFPDHDPDRDSVLGLVRGKKPNHQLATTKINEALNRDPGNSELYLIKAEILRRDNAKMEKIKEVYDTAFENAAVPEVFHDAVGFYLQRRQRKSAIVVLEAAVEKLPGEPRLKTRLAALLMREGRRPEATELLKTAMEQAPMLPDAYGIMGMLKRDEGAASLDDAETLLREAARLAPNDAVQVSRLADLLAHKARTAPEAEAEKLRTEARELLDPVLKDERKAPEAHLLLAQLVREEGKDLERAIWLLKKVKKQSDRSPDRKTRVAIEFARVDIARGDFDSAEKTIRGLADKDPSNHQVFSTLAQILEARQLLIPAHAEMLRAKERAPLGSLWAKQYDEDLARLQALIESGAGMPMPPPAPAAPSKPSIADIGPSSQKVIRRKAEKPEGSEEAPAEEAAAAEASEPEAAVEPAEAAAEASEAAADASEAAADEPAADASEAAADEPAAEEPEAAADASEAAADVEAALAPPTEPADKPEAQPAAE